MRLAFDFDGVQVDTGKIKAETAKRLFGVDIRPERCKSELVVDIDKILTLAEYRELTSVISRSELGLAVEPIEGAVKYLSLLRSEGHEICTTTSRDGEFLKTAFNVAMLRGLPTKFYGVGYKISKASALRGWDLFVDDDLEKLTDLKGIVRHRLLFSRPYNLHYHVPRGIIRVSSWESIYHYIQAHELIPHVNSLSNLLPKARFASAGGN